ncbi:MAG: FUSC family protein [Solirubrobacteraceae bacterium]
MTDDVPGTSQLLTRLTPAAEAAHQSLRQRVGRVRETWIAILQTGVAAGLAWFLARLIVGTPDPFFAPAAAVISTGLSRGQPLRRSAELAIGVAIGIGIAFLLRSQIGLGPWQIGGIVALTILAALLVDASIVLVNQAAISAVLVMTLPTASLGTGPDRFFDALVGGAVALLVGHLVFVRNPASGVAELARGTLGVLADCLRQGERALAAESLDQAQEALTRLRGIDSQLAALFEALKRAQEAAALSPLRRRALDALGPYGEASRHIDYAVRNGRVLLRTVAAALRTGAEMPAQLGQAILTLADSADALAAQLDGTGTAEAMRSRTIAATETATGVLATHNDLRTSMVIGQIRATAVDLLRASGLDATTARAALPPAQPEDL